MALVAMERRMVKGWSETWIEEGVAVELVRVRLEFSEYTKCIWIVNDLPDADGFVVLQKMGEQKTIRVSAQKIKPVSLELSPVVQRQVSDDQSLNLSVDVPFQTRIEAYAFSRLSPSVEAGPYDVNEAALNTWIPLPGYGGNSIMLRRRPPNATEMAPVMFPRLQALGLLGQCSQTSSTVFFLPLPSAGWYVI